MTSPMSMSERWEADEQLWDEAASRGEPVLAGDPSVPRWIEDDLSSIYGPGAPHQTAPDPTD